MSQRNVGTTTAPPEGVCAAQVNNRLALMLKGDAGDSSALVFLQTLYRVNGAPRTRLLHALLLHQQQRHI